MTILSKGDEGEGFGESRTYGYILLIGSAVLLCVLVISSLLGIQKSKIDSSAEWVTHTYGVMITGKELDANIQRMIVSERGFLLTRDPEFKASYFIQKTKTEKELVSLRELVQDNASQLQRLEMVQNRFERLRNILEIRLQNATEAGAAPIRINADAAVISAEIQQNIDAMMRVEDRLLAKRLQQQRLQQQGYQNLLYSGVACAAFIIILLNALVLRVQARKERIKTEADTLNQRFALAMKSTSDGIFDWNLAANNIYYSPRFKQMLGYADNQLESSISAIEALVHPDDIESLRMYTQDYLAGKYSEYNAVYRIRHKTGGYLWLHSRAKAIFDETGKPLRLIGAAADVTSMKAIEERLRVEKEVAVNANRAKTDFLTNMSHEIRTPLNAIIGVSGILARKLAKDEQQKEKLIDTLQHSSLSLLDLINDVLDLAKIESGEVDLEFKRFPLARLLQQVVSIMAVRAQEKGLSFKLDDHGLEEDHYSGDEARMRQILINLVGNAIKFTAEGSVTLNVERSGGELIFAIEDTGIGIDEKAIQKIFQKFEQADNSMTRKFGGTGLGLAISQKLANIMGGRIEVESTVGKGSVFTLLLPDNTDHEQADSGDFTPAKPIGEMNASELLGNKKILIAEDFENNLLVIKFFMESLGIPYDIAHNGTQAVALYKKHRHPFVMMDVQMPGMDGIEATRMIRDYEQANGLPPTTIIAMTAHAMAGDSARCIDAGMNDYLAKPLLESDIRQKLQLYFKAVMA